MQNILIGVLLTLSQPLQAEAKEIIPVELTIEERVEQTFNDPRMVDVLRCESKLKQYEVRNDGRLVALISPTSDVGIAQINQVHWKRAKELGLDIFNSIDDNLTMAKIIYDEQGISAWTCSKLVS